MDYTHLQIEDFIYKNYGQKVSIALKHKNLVKFGRNEDIGTTREDVWLVGGVEITPSDNLITHYASSNVSDTQDIIVEGHTIDGNGDLTFVVQAVTLAGQTKSALTTPLARVTRLYNISSTDFSGIVSVAKDVTFTTGTPASDIHLQTTGSNNQSLKASTSVEKNNYWIITQVTGAVKRTQTRFVDFFLQVREKGQVFRTKYSFSVSNQSGTITINFDEPIIIKPNSDVRVQAISSGSTTEVAASMHGILAKAVDD